MKRAKKYFSIISIILFIALLIISGYTLTKQQTKKDKQKVEQTKADKDTLKDTEK